MREQQLDFPTYPQRDAAINVKNKRVCQYDGNVNIDRTAFCFFTVVCRINGFKTSRWGQNAALVFAVWGISLPPFSNKEVIVLLNRKLRCSIMLCPETLTAV
jgi:hypothetical protein